MFFLTYIILLFVLLLCFDLFRLSHVYEVLDRIKLKLSNRTVPRAILLQQNKLKLISILINIVAHRLLQSNPAETKVFLTLITEAMRMVTRSSSSSDTSDSSSSPSPANVIADSTSTLLDNLPSTEPLLLVGFPLIVALWRVFYFSVEQFVAGTHPLLAREMLEQQCVIVESMVARHAAYRSLIDDANKSTMDRVIEFMTVHASRWQATMFLLCDCMNISANLLTKERLQFVHQIGQFFEWEGTVAHDLSRINLAASSASSAADAATPSASPNVYSLWLAAEKRVPSAESMQLFLEQINCESDRRRSAILADRSDADFFDVDHFIQTVRVVRLEYSIPTPSL
jgi:hypothetical protein